MLTLEKTTQKLPPNFKTKNRNYNQPVNSIDLNDAFIAYRNPNPSLKRAITLIRPPIIFSKNSYSIPLTQPIGLTYLGATLEKAGYAVQIIDCPGEDVGNIRMSEDKRFKIQGLHEKKSIKLIRPDTDIVGISIMFSQEWPFIRNYINNIRATFPKVTIIVGGEHITAMSEYSLRDCPAINYAILGEGELKLLEFVHKFRSGKSLEDVGGLAYLKDNKFVKTGLSRRLADIQNMPWPAWHLINLYAYFKPNFTMGIAHGRNMAMLATRGCPYQCTFCSNPSMWTTRYVMRPVADVVNEISHYVQKYGVNSIDFFDLTAIVKKEWILEFISELEKRKIKIVWQLPSGTRSESLDELVIDGLARTGCEFLVYAPESGSQRTLELIKKRVNLKNLTRSVSIAVRHGLVVKVNFIIGFPFETRLDIFKTLGFVWKLAFMKVDDCNISTFSPYPGSELFEQLVNQKEIHAINDQYFENLMTQFDFTISRTFCQRVGSAEMFFYRVTGMGLFYLISYLRSPRRLIRLLWAITSRKPFQPRSLFEQRVYDFIARFRNAKSSSDYSATQTLSV